MAVMKMKLVTVAGPIYEFERIVSEYIVNKEIHLENAITSLSENSKKLLPYSDDGQYSQIAKSIDEILSSVNFKPGDKRSHYTEVTKEKMLDYVKSVNNETDNYKSRIAEMHSKIEDNKNIVKQLETLSDMNIELDKLFNFEFMSMRFGKLPKTSERTLSMYLKNLDAVFVKMYEDETHIWGLYFMPSNMKQQVDTVFASLYFERVRIPDSVKGTPDTAIKTLKEQNIELNKQIQDMQSEMKKNIQNNYYKLSDYYNISMHYAEFSSIRKKAAHTDEFFFLVGWMADKDAKKLEKELGEESSVLFIGEEPEGAALVGKTPTKLHNIGLFRPFEFFVKMYGMPSYGEIDPTPIMAISYILLFGIMFGDVGQSMLFFIGGLILYLKKKIDLAAIISMVGVSGTIFGFIYGSIFGNETLLAGIRLIEPMDKISFMLGGAVVIGIVIIFVCMILNIINAVRQKKWGRLLFNQNGLAGLIFYGALLAFAAVSFLMKDAEFNTNILVILLAVTFVMMFMQEPLAKLVEKKKNWMPKEGMFFVESFFEMFDVLLSFVTNTISFLRVGAFAIIHVGMMMVVSVLAERSGGAGNIITMIIGNIIVMGLEGLIVGIQVLRLEYYEMFSRYYDGNGRKFEGIGNKAI